MPLFAQELTVPTETMAAAELGAQVDRLQTAAFGVMQSPALTDSALRIDGASNTWVWRLEERNNVSYLLLGNVMFLNIFLAFTTTLPTATGTFYVTIPDGFEAGSVTQQDRPGSLVRAHIVDGSGTLADGLAITERPGATATAHRSRYVRFTRSGGGTFTAGNTTLAAQLWFEVRPFGGGPL
jgi:hypothetical protein